MRLLRMPTRLILLWTLLYGVAMWSLIEMSVRAPDPECREWCDLERSVAFTLMPIVTLIWVAVSCLTWWLWRRTSRE